MGTGGVVNFEGATFDADSHAEAVGDTDAGQLGTAVGLGEGHHRVGDVLGGEDKGRGAGRCRQLACGTHRGLPPWCQSPGRATGAGDTYVSWTNVPLNCGSDRGVGSAINAFANP